MELIYRTLGLTAFLTERASRTRGNGVPVNWLLMAVFGFLCGLGIVQIIEVKTNEGAPIETTIAKASEALKDRYITVTGHFYPNGTLVKVDKNGNPKNKKVGFVPLVDPEQRSAIYVQIDSSDNLDGVIRTLNSSEARPPDAGPRLSVSGMLRSLDSDLKKDTRLNSPPVGNARLDQEYMLVAAQKPGHMALWVALAAAMGLIVLPMLLVIFKRYVIFRSQPPPRHGVDLRSIAPDPSEQFDLRVTAHFYLDQKLRQRFHRVPGVIAELQNGDAALLANVDASVNFMGTKTEDRSGIWAVVIANGSLGKPQYGTLYFGLTAFPAFRIQYTDPIRNKPATAILASTTPAGRERVRQALYERPPASVSPPSAPIS